MSQFRQITTKSPLRLPKADVIGIVLHWTAGHYRQMFGDYHFLIGPEGEIYQNELASPGFPAQHTYRRNTGRIGISAMAMAGATPENYGPYRYTKIQLEAMCALAARLAHKYGIPPEEIRTHAEWAAADGYGPGSGDPETRWDWMREGPVIHRKVAWYLERLRRSGS